MAKYFNRMQEEKTLEEKIVEGIQERKGRGISILDMAGINNAGVESFIICQGTSPTHVASVADSVRDYLQKNYGIKPYNYDGYRNAQWIIIDYGSVLVHVFTPEWREHYNLEELWSDSKISVIPDLD